MRCEILVIRGKASSIGRIIGVIEVVIVIIVIRAVLVLGVVRRSLLWWCVVKS